MKDSTDDNEMSLMVPVLSCSCVPYSERNRKPCVNRMCLSNPIQTKPKAINSRRPNELVVELSQSRSVEPRGKRRWLVDERERRQGQQERRDWGRSGCEGSPARSSLITYSVRQLPAPGLPDIRFRSHCLSFLSIRNLRFSQPCHPDGASVLHDISFSRLIVRLMPLNFL